MQAQVKAAYNYFAVYQTQLAVLLANYWHSKPDTYSQSTIQQSLAQIQRNVTEQRTALKPRLPDGSWIDPATGLMWTFSIDPVSFPTYFQYYYPISVLGGKLDPVGGRPFTDWRLASSAELYGHTSDIKGSARVYLNAQLGYEDAVRATTWTSDSFVLEQVAYEAGRDTRMLHLRIFNLNSNQFENLTDPGHQFNRAIPAHSWPLSYYGKDQLNSADGQAWQASKRADGLLYVRKPAAGEDYWWGSARAGG
jgi:hypothetical protein